jgi:hypothetical protein
MTSGRKNKLTGQTGEYLVAAELSRMGLIATTFTGNVPHYDIIASDEKGRHVSLQVKAATRGSWQFGNVGRYCEVSFDGKRQIVGALKPAPVRNLVTVFVKIGHSAPDNFYVLTWGELASLLAEKHTLFLKRHDGVRPRKWDSLHVAVKERMLLPFRDNWQIIYSSFA